MSASSAQQAISIDRVKVGEGGSQFCTLSLNYEMMATCWAWGGTYGLLTSSLSQQVIQLRYSAQEPLLD